MEKSLSKPRSQDICSGLRSVTVEFSFFSSLSLFHIKEVIVERKVILPFFQTNNVFTEAGAYGLSSKRLNVYLMCLLFYIRPTIFFGLLIELMLVNICLKS